MKVNITLKDQQKECLDKVTSDLSLENHEKTIKKLIHGIFELNQNDDVFGDYRCVGDCYSTDQSLEIELDDETVSKIKGIFQKYDFDDYDSEEEEISKIIRSMINFADEEEDIKTIFTSWGGCKMGFLEGYEYSLPMKWGFNSSYVLNPLKIEDLISCWWFEMNDDVLLDYHLKNWLER